MTPLLLAITAGAGVYLLAASALFGRRSTSVRASVVARSSRRIDEWLAQAGLATVDRRQLGTLTATLFVGGALTGWVLFGGVIAPLCLGLFAASFPPASSRARRQRRRAEAAEGWPRMIEEIRLLCGSLGRPIPQALFEVGRQGPAELRDAFITADREYRISTDFERSVAILKEQLADATADATCETLLVAHQLGGQRPRSSPRCAGRRPPRRLTGSQGCTRQTGRRPLCPAVRARHAVRHGSGGSVDRQRPRRIRHGNRTTRRRRGNHRAGSLLDLGRPVDPSAQSGTSVPCLAAYVSSC